MIRGGDGGGPESHGGIIIQADCDHGGDAGPRAGPGRGLRPARAHGHRLRSGRRGDRGSPRALAHRMTSKPWTSGEDRVKAWAGRFLAASGGARPADQQRSPNQPQRADLGGPRRGVRPSHRREHQGGRQRSPPCRPGDDRAGVRGDRQPQLVLGPFRLARGRPVLRLEVGDRGSDAAPWPRNSRRAWPPSPSTRASSTPRCSAAPSARRPATT